LLAFAPDGVDRGVGALGAELSRLTLTYLGLVGAGYEAHPRVLGFACSDEPRPK
jgi:hypothetical protein